MFCMVISLELSFWLLKVIVLKETLLNPLHINNKSILLLPFSNYYECSKISRYVLHVLLKRTFGLRRDGSSFVGRRLEKVFSFWRTQACSIYKWDSGESPNLPPCPSLTSLANPPHLLSLLSWHRELQEARVGSAQSSCWLRNQHTNQQSSAITKPSAPIFSS